MQRLLQVISTTALVLAVFSLGAMAGFFGTYAGNVSPATLELDGPTYALVQSAFNRHVRHALFFACFFGPVPLCLLALVGDWRQRPAWWWWVAGIGLAYALGIVFFTREVNLPLNHLTESWTPSTLPADWAATRDAWNQANAWRAVCSAGLFAAGLWALVARAHALGRSASTAARP